MSDRWRGRVLDRVPRRDPASLAYPIRTLLPSKAPRSYTWRHVQLDQGAEGACTGFSATMEAAARPKPFFGDPLYAPPSVSSLNSTARGAYARAKQIDEWDGEDYEGSSVLAAAKVGVERGWWREYRWALGPGPENAADDVIAALGYNGPVMMGTWWYESMWTSGKDGFLPVAGDTVGGHAWLLTSYNKPKDAVWTPNSWGGAGQGWIARAGLVKLLADQGEACVAVRRRLPTDG